MLGCVSLVINNHEFFILTNSTIYSPHASNVCIFLCMPILYHEHFLMIILFYFWKCIFQMMKMFFHTNKWVQMTYNKPMCLLCIYDYCPFWGHFSQKTCFLKEEFSNEMFWNFLYIVFIVAPICHTFFYIKFGKIWIFESAQILLDFVFCLEIFS